MRLLLCTLYAFPFFYYRAVGSSRYTIIKGPNLLVLFFFFTIETSTLSLKELPGPLHFSTAFPRKLCPVFWELDNVDMEEGSVTSNALLQSIYWCVLCSFHLWVFITTDLSGRGAGYYRLRGVLFLKQRMTQNGQPNWNTERSDSFTWTHSNFENKERRLHAEYTVCWVGWKFRTKQFFFFEASPRRTVLSDDWFSAESWLYFIGLCEGRNIRDYYAARIRFWAKSLLFT